MHEHLEQEIAELLAQCSRFVPVDGLEDFIRLLEQIRAQAAMRLLAVPRASTRCAESPTTSLSARSDCTASSRMGVLRSNRDPTLRAHQPAQLAEHRRQSRLPRVAEVQLRRRGGDAAELCCNALQVEPVVEGETDDDTATALGVDASAPAAAASRRTRSETMSADVGAGIGPNRSTSPRAR